MINCPDFDFSRRFGGIQRLYGEHISQVFYQAHIGVIGLGGVGSWAVEALARTGIKKLTLIDLDNVAESNINRQLPALSSEIGKAKVSVLAQRIIQINPCCEVVEIEDFIDEDNLSDYLDRDYDFVIDAIDQVRIKAAIANYCIKHKIPLAVSGGAGGQRHPEYLKVADLRDVTHDKLLANMRYTLRKKYDFSKNTKDKFKINCVYSTENIIAPQTTEQCDLAPQGLSCAGYGASMLVTASFGLHLAHLAIEHLAKAAQ